MYDGVSDHAGSILGLGYPVGTGANIAGMYGAEESYVGAGCGISGGGRVLTVSPAGMQLLGHFSPTSAHEYPWMMGVMQSGSQMSGDPGMDIGAMASPVVYPQHSVQSRSFMGSPSQSM